MLLATGCLVCGGSVGPVCVACAAAVESAPPVEGLSLPVRALVRYEGVGRELVTALKYRNGRRLVPAVAPLLADLVAGVDADVVAWVPASRAGRQDRGYDQSRLLAAAVARVSRLPCRDLLRRGPGPPQTGRTRDDRAQGPTLLGRRKGPGTVIVVDDVITTGATMTTAASTLRGHGWRPVAGLSLAATPRLVGAGAGGPR